MNNNCINILCNLVLIILGIYLVFGSNILENITMNQENNNSVTKSGTNNSTNNDFKNNSTKKVTFRDDKMKELMEKNELNKSKMANSAKNILPVLAENAEYGFDKDYFNDVDQKIF